MEDKKSNSKGGFAEFFNVKQVFAYFFTKRPNQGIYTKAMHTINKISIVVFLLGVCYLIYRNVF